MSSVKSKHVQVLTANIKHLWVKCQMLIVNTCKCLLLTFVSDKCQVLTLAHSLWNVTNVANVVNGKC